MAANLPEEWGYHGCTVNVKNTFIHVSDVEAFSLRGRSLSPNYRAPSHTKFSQRDLFTKCDDWTQNSQECGRNVPGLTVADARQVWRVTHLGKRNAKCSRLNPSAVPFVPQSDAKPTLFAASTGSTEAFSDCSTGVEATAYPEYHNYPQESQTANWLNPHQFVPAYESPEPVRYTIDESSLAVHQLMQLFQQHCEMNNLPLNILPSLRDWAASALSSQAVQMESGAKCPQREGSNDPGVFASTYIQ